MLRLEIEEKSGNKIYRLSAPEEVQQVAALHLEGNHHSEAALEDEEQLPHREAPRYHCLAGNQGRRQLSLHDNGLLPL